MSVFTPEDLAFFEENGYVIARNVVPVELCNAVVNAIFEFLGMDPNNPEDWYRPPLKPGGMIEMYQHQALWDTRQYPRVHQAFSEIFGTPKLCVTIDRVNMKPPRHPNHPEYDHKGFIHWDVDTSKLPLPFAVQGVLCLTDTTEDMGGFQCIPGFHKGLEEWIATQPPDRNPRVPDLNALPPGKKVVPIPAKAGDLIIWINTLAHGNGHNVSNRPRFSQYISMFPAERLTEEQRQHRIHCWKNRLPPGNSVFPGDPREIEQKYQKTAELTPLGRKLLGLDPWD
ncbi:MAG TPA: phytanoyl-CoA dioxygenase family protein [Chthonomonas sp.]|uniref:phytanoyl-CoA dioxygenase family protein n=1 Tax=Chthonomonas sp. TaxID=2282153 RepID=UPI002B4B2494|nr:phytanoyl-CoA dioxygenase family protein [Chthonomonas sp.]HLI49326.1 phytanoyl-CoA dioxygenase family protein [Chthonomonas sp.]